MEDIFRERVRERDLDNFLVEEIFASPVFLDWIVAYAGSGFEPPVGLTVLLQKSPPREGDRRQTDVRIGWFDETNEMHACILIESKVTADFQSGQGQAYAEELVALRRRLGPAKAAALLIAPAARLCTLSHDQCFDNEVAVEEIIEFLESRAAKVGDDEIGRRLKVRIQLLEALCGKRSNSGWVGSTIAEKRNFAEAYADLAAQILPDLKVRPSTDGPKAITRIFDGLHFDGFPPLALRHEFGTEPGWKYANVQFRGRADLVGPLKASVLFAGTPYSALEAGKSAAIRGATPAVDPMRPFPEQREAVERGLLAIRDMVAWLRASEPDLTRLLNQPAQTAAGSPPTEADFAKELWATYHECEKLGYKPTGMLQMMSDHGPIHTAKRLLATPPSDGFNRLALLGRLDLTIEAIALREPWSALFTPDELKKASRRLR